MKRRVLATLGGVLLLFGALAAPSRAQEPAATNPEIERLKAQLAAQQDQIDQLRRVLDEQKKVLDQATQPKAGEQTASDQASQPKPPSLGQVASTAGIVPAGDVAPVLHPGLSAALSLQPQGEPASPLQLHVGTATITPIGFMDMTAVFRSADGGSSIGTNFGSIPYNNASTGLGKLSEIRFSAQNSRIGARVDATVHNTHVLGYWESDFLGNQSTNASVTSNAITFRMRLYFVDLRNGKWELLGGQSWSMMTPGRKGISPLPSDIFYSQNMDTNYQVGLVVDPRSPVPRRVSRQRRCELRYLPWSKPNNMAAARAAAARSFCPACFRRPIRITRSTSAPRVSPRRTCIRTCRRNWPSIRLSMATCCTSRWAAFSARSKPIILSPVRVSPGRAGAARPTSILR